MATRTGSRRAVGSRSRKRTGGVARTEGTGTRSSEKPPRGARGRGGRAGKGPMPRGKKTNKSETQHGSLSEPVASRMESGKKAGERQGRKGK
jgi:hypothetical protein